MRSYYYLINSFPELKIGEKPDISFEELKFALDRNLSKADKKIVADFLFSVDLKNIKAFWMGEPLDPTGNLPEKELEEALLVEGILPPYVYEFLEKYETQEERLQYFSFLYASYFRSFQKGFLGNYFQQEREIRFHLAALRAKKTGKDLSTQFPFEDPSDPLVGYILAQKDREEYDIPLEYEPLKQIFSSHYDSPLHLLKAYLEYRMHLIEDLEKEDFFSLARVLAFIAKLLLVKHFLFFTEEKGKEALQRLW